MAVEECEVCGAVVGDSAKHRRWHADHDAGRSAGSPAAAPAAGDAPAATRGPETDSAVLSGPAVRPDTGPGNGLTPGLLAQGQALFTHLLGAGPTPPPGAADGDEPVPEGRPERPWRLR